MLQQEETFSGGRPLDPMIPPAAFSAPLEVVGGFGAAATAAPRLLPASPAPSSPPPLRHPPARYAPAVHPYPGHLVPMATGAAEEGPVGAHLLGLSTLLVGLGSMVGLRFGGLQGATSGALFGGAAVNLYRAVKYSTLGSAEADREAMVSGTYAVAAAAVAGYILWKRPAAKKIAAAHEQEFSLREPTKASRRLQDLDRKNQDGCATANARRSCGIRPV